MHEQLHHWRFQTRAWGMRLYDRIGAQLHNRPRIVMILDRRARRARQA